MKNPLPLIAAGLFALCLATPASAQVVSVNPLGLDGDPLHAFSPPPPAAPAPAYFLPSHHKHRHHK